MTEASNFAQESGRQALLSSLLRGGECSCGRTHPVTLRALVMERGALKKLPGVISSLGTFGRICMICDENTYEAAGRRVGSLISPFSVITLDPEGLHASDEVIDEVRKQLPEADLLVAVGSGTIHDVTRFMAVERGIEFISVPTAASVDGYLSSIAAMTWRGVKRSFPAKGPVALVADADVIAAAPYALTASGVGDLIGKYTALFDWRAAHLVTGEYICGRILSLEEDAIRAVADRAEAVRAQDPSAVEDVTYGLVLSGLCMQMVGNSRPASGSEHHISHLIEMEVLQDGDDALHGEKVGVATALVSDFIHAALAHDLPDPLPAYEGLPLDELKEVFKSRADEVIGNENTPDPLTEVDPSVLRAEWGALRVLAEETLPSGEEIRALLRACGAKSRPEEIRLDPARAEDYLVYAPYVRRRLTFLRLAKLLTK